MQVGLGFDLTLPTGPLSTDGQIRSAQFSSCGKYRLELVREWSDGEGTALAMLANPSTADHLENDNTVTRLCGFVRAVRIRRLVVCNFYAFIATKPKHLIAARDAGVDVVGPGNDETIARHAEQASRIIIGCGAFHWVKRRALQACSEGGVLFGKALECLDVTTDGAPGHPLYLPNSATLRPYSVDDLKRWAGSADHSRRPKKR